jgi:YHS domain-containing protein
VSLNQRGKGNIMAFSVESKKSGKTYYLHSKDVKLKGDRIQTIYYFGGEAKENALDELPKGYIVIENERTGLPMLKKG